MARTVRLNNYTDFDRLLIGKNFIVTVIGSIGAFALSFFQITAPIPIPPYNLSLSLALMIIVTIYTANIASALLVSLVGSIGLVGVDGGPVDFMTIYILVNVIAMVILGYFSDKLRLVTHWNRLYLFYAAVFSTVSIVIGYFWNEFAPLYWSNDIHVGTGGDFDTGTGLPILDVGILFVIYLLLILFAIILRGQIQLDRKSAQKYRYLGLMFVLLGQLVTIVPLVQYSIRTNRSVLANVAINDSHLSIITDLFTRSNTMAIIGEDVHIFFIMALTVTFTNIGLALLNVARYQGNMDGTKGGSSVAFLAAPIAFILYFILGSYHVQLFVAPGGLFIPIELFTLFAAMIWAVWFLNALVARIVLLLLDRL